MILDSHPGWTLTTAGVVRFPLAEGVSGFRKHFDIDHFVIVYMKATFVLEM